VNGRWGDVRTRRKNLIGALLAMAAFSIGMCLVAVYNGSIALGLANRGITTDATVVRIERFPKGDRTTVEFTTREGETVSVECTSCEDDLDTGDRVRIRYDPENFAVGVEDVNNQGGYRDGAVFGVIALAVTLSAAGVIGWRLARERRT
jgi:hypothetical protein